MRVVGILFGVSSILVYSVLGALLMNNWAVTAASEVPLDEAITAMNAANQPYSATQGIAFAVVGCMLAFIWAFVAYAPKIRVSNWTLLAAWAGILTFGAPAFFFASFSNMNSVGDTFPHWNAAAAFALEAPLYITSVVAAMTAVVATVLAVARGLASARSPRP